MPSRPTFHEALNQLWTGMAELAGQNVETIRDATRALHESDRELAEKVIADGTDSATRQDRMDQQVVELIALQQPVASDLRLVISTIPMSAALIRMGGLARHVAQTVRLRTPEPVVAGELAEIFERIGRAAVDIATELHAALTDRDAAQADAVVTSDHAMDALHHELFTILLEPSWPHGTEAAVDATLLGRFYERFADQAVNVARRIDFILTGSSLT